MYQQANSGSPRLPRSHGSFSTPGRLPLARSSRFKAVYVLPIIALALFLYPHSAKTYEGAKEAVLKVPSPWRGARLSKSGSEAYSEERGYLHYPNIGVDPLKGGRKQGEVRHPISWLIEEAERKWDAMLARQSQTLEQAVAEYKRRHGRKPPRGFDKWWNYAQQNNVVLVDEYDQINTDISPFLSLPAELVLQRSEDALMGTKYMPVAGTFAVQVKDGIASLLPGPNVETSRAFDVLQGVKKFAHLLPDIRIPFTIADGPGVATSGEEKQLHLLAAGENRKLTTTEFDSLGNLADQGYALTETLCPPDSLVRKAVAGNNYVAPNTGPSFVGLDHLTAMDMCQHPEHRWQHGQTIVQGMWGSELFPLIASSKTGMHSDILTTPMEQYYTPLGNDPDWGHKAHNKVLWRGSTTGSWHGKEILGWRGAHRPRLVTALNAQSGERSVVWSDASEGDVMRKRLVNEKDANAHWFDVAYVGYPLQCNYIPDMDETCVYMKENFRFEGHMSTDEANAYKYILDVDGNAWSGRFHRLMSTSACVLKSTIYPEWWTSRAVPWFHYVPVKVDYSDLHDVASYFIGGEGGKGNHDEQARKIGLQGKEWAEKHWRLEDTEAYQLRLFLELARAYFGDRDGSYDYQG